MHLAWVPLSTLRGFGLQKNSCAMRKARDSRLKRHGVGDLESWSQEETS